MIKAIIFDWGGVLIKDPHEGLMKYYANALGISKNDFEETFRSYLIDFQKGLITEKELWISIKKDLGLRTKITESLWIDGIRTVFKVNPEILELIHELKKKGYKTALCSNTEIPTTELFFQRGWDKLFDTLVFSCNEGTIKPEEKIFRICLEKLKIDPNETIFIDDKKEFIDGAKKMGIIGIQFIKIESLMKDLQKFGVQVNNQED